MNTKRKAKPLTLVSGQSPFANCTLGGPGVNYLNAEVEPYAAVNPTTLENIGKENVIGVWQQDRWSNGAAKGIVAGVSFDGGKTWKKQPLPFDTCVRNGLPFERASDPWVSFGADGTAYVAALVFNPANEDTAITTITSKDGGNTWSSPRIIQQDTGSAFFNDKESITADPRSPQTAYVVWHRLEFLTGNRFKAPAWFAKTTDGGKTWKSKIIYDPGINNNTGGSVIVVEPITGRLYHFFTVIFNNDGEKSGFLVVQKSDNGGDNWSRIRVISKIYLPNTIEETAGTGVVGTFSYLGASLRTSVFLFVPAIDPRNGRLYIVWEDAGFTNGQVNEIALSFSNDGGTSWSKPIRVNNFTGAPAFIPSVQVNTSGAVGVGYYQFTEKTPTNFLPAQYVFKLSGDGGRSFINKEIQVSKPFDMLTAPFARGFFIGDYQGLFTIGNTFHPFFVKTNSRNEENRTDVFTTEIPWPPHVIDGI